MEDADLNVAMIACVVMFLVGVVTGAGSFSGVAPQRHCQAVAQTSQYRIEASGKITCLRTVDVPEVDR